jgi:uncharacterized protein YbaR (Trm112 family)
LDPRLLDILVCPVTKGPLTYDKVRQELISKSARLAYPIRDGIPIMLETEARVLDPVSSEPPPSEPSSHSPTDGSI